MKDFKLEKWEDNKFLFVSKNEFLQNASMTEILLYRILEQLEKLNKSKIKKKKTVKRSLKA